MLSSVAKDVVLPQSSSGVLVTAGGVAASTVEMLSSGGEGVAVMVKYVLHVGMPSAL